MREAAAMVIVTTLLVADPVSAAQKETSVTDNAFVPRVHTVRIGDSVHWGSNGTSNPHNVREDNLLFRSGAPATGAIDFTRVFSAGSFHVYCEVHGSVAGGMDGLIRVKPRISGPPAGLPFTVRWASPPTTTGDAFDVQFRVGRGRWRPWKTNTTTFRGVFGKGGRPVRARDGIAYSFRARSQASPGADDTASRWSPVVTVRAKRSL